MSDDLNETRNLWADFSKSSQYKISRKSARCEQSWYVRTDGRMDMTEQIVTFRNFTNAPNN
jgi:hypothetical protein